jgi:hypothetical protein
MKEMRIAECEMRNRLRRVPRSNDLLTATAAFLLPCFLLAAETPAYKTETLRGRAVYLTEAFEKQTGIASVPEARERIIALQTADGTLVPLLEDARGRAFRNDDRLRQMDLELLVRRYSTSPAVQIIRVVEITKEGRFEIDYWCDICAIPLVENRECDCCQGPVELRRRKVTD